MALRAIEKKTIKMNKNVKIYQYIAVNTKNMTTKIVKRLKTDSKRKWKRDNNKPKAKFSLAWIHTQIGYNAVTN